jgi:hypothetical protein
MAQTLLTTKKSSNVGSVSYNDRTRTLSVTFVNGLIYDCLKVPSPTAKGIMEAESTGEYFHKYIRNSFECVRRQ